MIRGFRTRLFGYWSQFSLGVYVEAVDEAGGDAVEELTEEKVVTAAELGLEDGAEEIVEDVEAAAVVEDTIFELEADDTTDWFGLGHLDIELAGSSDITVPDHCSHFPLRRERDDENQTAVFEYDISKVQQLEVKCKEMRSKIAVTYVLL